jgi:hypothetical protein
MHATHSPTTPAATSTYPTRKAIKSLAARDRVNHSVFIFLEIDRNLQVQEHV